LGGHEPDFTFSFGSNPAPHREDQANPRHTAQIRFVKEQNLGGFWHPAPPIVSIYYE
jgi:hypothetical protein